MDDQLKLAVEQAQQTARLAAARRKALRRRTEVASPDREESLRSMIDRLHRDMAPIRSAIGKIPYGKISPRDEATLRAVSKAMKYERKQIRKMQRG